MNSLLKDRRDRTEFPFPEHIQDRRGKPLCGTSENNPILLEIQRDNPPECICPKCRKILSNLCKYNWYDFLEIINKD